MHKLDADWISERFYAPGEVLVPQWGKLGTLFVLKSGTVEVERDGKVVARTSQEGTLFGEMSVLLDRPHSASVRAVTAVEAYVIADPLTVLEARPAWTLQLARLLAQRLHATTAALVASREDAATAAPLIMPAYIMAQLGDPAL
jgi:CRP/FNR family transcriptional regulator, cyclic AMP receptor protein